jgi:hypothetical protein
MKENSRGRTVPVGGVLGPFLRALGLYLKLQETSKFKVVFLQRAIREE